MLIYLMGVQFSCACVVFHCLLMTQVSATSLLASHWVRTDGAEAERMAAGQVSLRSKSACAARCQQWPRCSQFAFDKRSGSCLVEDPDSGTKRTLTGYQLYYTTLAPVTTVQPETTPPETTPPEDTTLPETTTTEDTTQPGFASLCPTDSGFRYSAQYGTCIFHVFFAGSPKLTWNESATRCIDLGGHLYNFQTEDKFDALQEYFSRLGINPWAQWIGASDEAVEGQWVWTDGTSANSMLQGKWVSGEPDNWGSYGEDFVWIDGSNWDLRDKSRTDRSEGYICEVDL